jgi:hypothetical protein
MCRLPGHHGQRVATQWHPPAVIKTRWDVNLNEVTLYEANIPAAVTYTVTSQRSGEVRTFGQRPIAEKYFDQEVARSQGRERI